MKHIYTAVLAGVGGYGQVFLKRLLDPVCDLPIKLVGGVDPYAKSSPMYEELVKAGIPLYDSLEAFYAQHTADIAIISTPIHFHKEQSIYCMEHGSHVLCEKPICAVIDEAAAMAEARDRTGKQLLIGFQWCCSDAIRTMKQDILSGRYGKLLSMKTIVLWPRDFAYYRRGIGWAARKKAPTGEWILDSVANNATAHYLQNMLFTAGAQMDRSAQIDQIEVQTYRANPIEMFDTCALRAKTVDGISLLFLASHAIQKERMRGPEFIFTFEKGEIRADAKSGRVMVKGYLEDQTEVTYGDPNALETIKLDWMIKVLEEGAPVLCGLEAASEHTRCINRIAELIPDTPLFPEDQIITDTENDMVYCKDLDQVLGRCFDEGCLPCELAEGGFGEKKVGSLRGYSHFQL